MTRTATVSALAAPPAGLTTAVAYAWHRLGRASQERLITPRRGDEHAQPGTTGNTVIRCKLRPAVLAAGLCAMASAAALTAGAAPASAAAAPRAAHVRVLTAGQRQALWERGPRLGHGAGVVPQWNNSKSCPSWVLWPGDVLCYFAWDGPTETDPVDWVAMHVYYNSSTGHDAAWANGYSPSLADTFCVDVYDQVSGTDSSSPCGDAGTGRQSTGSIPDGPSNKDLGELWLFTPSGLVQYHTPSF